MNMRQFKTGFQRAKDLEPGVASERTIADVERVEFDDGSIKAVLHFENAEQSVVLNQPRLAVMIEAFGPNSENWVGRTILIRRGSTTYSGKIVPAIVIETPERTPKIAATKPAPELEGPRKRDKMTILSGKPPIDDDPSDGIPF
jgi:hypothetical protein